MHLRYYLEALWKDWVSRMSGLASIVLAFVAVVFPSVPAKPTLWMAAAICFMVANYMVWLGTQPVLSIEIMDVYLGSGVLPHESLSDAYITVVFRMCAKTATLAIKDMECLWKSGGVLHSGVAVPCRGDEQWVASQSHPDGGIDLLMFMSSAMSQGWLKSGWLRFQFATVAPMDIAGARLKIIVRDSYDVKHVVRCDAPSIRSERDYGVFVSSTPKPVADLRRAPIGSAEWLALADRFKEISRDVHLQWQRTRCGDQAPVDHWRVSGGGDGGHKCKALCAMAGAMLVKSRGVAGTLSEEVRNATNDAGRWFCFLREAGVVKYDRTFTEELDGVKIVHHLGVMAEVAPVSSRVCIECSAKEI